MNSKYSRSSQTLFENIDGEAVILNFPDGCYYGLNATGKLIWEALEHPQSIPDLCQVIEANFNCEDFSPEDEVSDFIDSLIAPGLIHVHDP